MDLPFDNKEDFDFDSPCMGEKESSTDSSRTSNFDDFDGDGDLGFSGKKGVFRSGSGNLKRLPVIKL